MTDHPERVAVEQVDWAKIGYEYAEAVLNGTCPRVQSPQYALSGTFKAMADEITSLRLAAQSAHPDPQGVPIALVRLSEAATWGEWSAKPPGDDGSVWIDSDEEGDMPVAMIASGSPHGQDIKDGNFIVAAVQYVRKQIALATTPPSPQPTPSEVVDAKWVSPSAMREAIEGAFDDGFSFAGGRWHEGTPWHEYALDRRRNDVGDRLADLSATPPAAASGEEN